MMLSKKRRLLAQKGSGDVMDVKQVFDMLKRMSKGCEELANKLDSKGVPLSGKEKQLVRFAAYSMVDEVTTELKFAFLIGNVEWLDHSVEALKSQLKPFMD